MNRRLLLGKNQIKNEVAQTSHQTFDNFFPFSLALLDQKVVYSSAATTIGHSTRKHQDWFDENAEEIKLLFEEKK